MVSRKISIPLIIIVAAVVVLLVSINQPFQRAEAIERQEITATETSVQELQPSDQKEIQPTVSSFTPTNDPSLPSVKLEEPTDLVKVNELLKGKINSSLLQPGWLQIIKEYTSFIETAETSTIPENGQIIPRDYRLEQWLSITEDLKINVQYIRGTSFSGQEYTSTLYSKDQRWSTVETTPLDAFDLPSALGTRALDDIIQMGFAGDARIEYRDEEGFRVVTITTITQFPRPVGFNGWEDAKVIEYTQTYFYNWENGLPLRSEEIITREDGSQMLAGESIYSVSQFDELPSDVLERMNNISK